jgi:outer membrane protein TolC
MFLIPVRLAMIFIVLLVCRCWSAPATSSVAGTNDLMVVQLKLDGYLLKVLDHNQALQSQMFGSEASRRKWRSEYGAFEPQLELSAMQEVNKRTNNTEQQASQGGGTYFEEFNNLYDSGVESLLPTGGKVRLGYTLSDLENNVSGNVFNPTSTNLIRQYQTFVGATFTQPLLKGGGFGVALASLRLAAAESEIGFQQYRRQLMLTVAQAESAYWNLYFAQEQLQFFDDSVAVAQTVLDDSEHKFHAGQGAELDVMEAQSGLALRQTKRNEAMQGYLDAQGNLRTLAGLTPAPLTAGPAADLTIHAVDAPPGTNVLISYADGFAGCVTLNPDYLIQKQKLREEELRSGVAKNQMLPELDFKAAYGFNGLGDTPGESWDVAQSGDYPSWSVGLQMTIPLAGNIKGRNLASAAKFSLREAYANLSGTQTEIANHLITAIRKTQAWQESIHSYQTVVRYNEELLQTDFARLTAGTVDGRKVLEVEADLLEARQDLANALVQCQESQLQVELASGSLLQSLHLEVTRDELRGKATSQLSHDNNADDVFQN